MSFLTDALGGAISSIRVETAFGPTVNLDHPFSPGPPSLFLQLLKPTVTLNPGADGAQVIAPYGESHGEWWPVVLGALAVGVAVAGTAIFRYVKKNAHRPL